MAMVELVDYNEVYNPNGAKKKKATRRGRKKRAAAQWQKLHAAETPVLKSRKFRSIRCQ